MTSTSIRHTGARSLVVLALTLLPLTLAARAQSADAKSSDTDCSKLPTRSEREDCAGAHSQAYTIHLRNVTGEEQANQIATAIRNTSDSNVRVYLLGSQNELAIETYPEEYARIEALVHSLDRPIKTYRVTYTLTELDAGKTISTEHYSMLLGDGERSSLKEGNKVPVATGTFTPDGASSGSTQTQFTYLDIGMSFDASIFGLTDGIRLKSKVEESSLDQPSTIAGVTEPVVRQSVLEGTAVLPLDKPAMLGTIDVPNSTRHIDIAVVIEQVK